MSAEVKQLLHEALKLSTDDRAELAAELLASLDESGDSGDVEGAWAAEIERRARRVLAGESSGTPGEEVRERFGRDLLKRGGSSFGRKTKRSPSSRMPFAGT